MIRLNQNARTELAAEASLHPISCCALKWRLRRRRRPGRHAFISLNPCGIGGDDGASLEPARSAKWKKRGGGSSQGDGGAISQKGKRVPPIKRPKTRFFRAGSGRARARRRCHRVDDV